MIITRGTAALIAIGTALVTAAGVLAAPAAPAAPVVAPAAPAPAAPEVPAAAPVSASVAAAAGQVAGRTAAAALAGCSRVPGATPRVRVTQVDVGSPVTGYGGEGDTEPLPMAIAARPSGGSWLAWLGTDSRVHLAKLGCGDKLVGTPVSFPGIDLQDVQADASGGGVLLLTRPGDCRTGPLCGGSSSPCRTMWMVRFNANGVQLWERQVTNLTPTRGGYDDGARFVWWYQHHGRLATDGTNFAAYFGVAITVRNGACVDIHEGDRMQVVSGSGALLTGHDSFEVGCSHAWTSRIVWDPRSSHFVTVCATDNACRIARPNPYQTVAAGTCDGTLFGGDLVLGSTGGFWTAWSQGGRARLEHFVTAASDRTVSTTAATSHPHLVPLGTGRMLLAWESGTAMRAQVYDAAAGTTVGTAFTVGVRDHAYQAFKPYADGSAAYPAAGGTPTSIAVARVIPPA